LLWRRKGNPDEEIEEYRDLLETPTEYSEGFTLKTLLGVLFVSIVMVPGNMYLQLMIGGGLGAAAQWVTIILFTEVAKRSFTTLKRQEVYLLFYVASSLISAETGTFRGLIWSQYLIQSPAAKQFGIAHLIPKWVAPQPDSPAIINRTFFHTDWLPAIGLLVAGMVIGRVSWITMGYSLFRLTSDVEKLPFPFAPVNVQGATALAETTSGEETWRWRVFSAGAMIGLVFGTIYVGIPAFTGAIMTEPIQLIPIPFVDFTHFTGNFLPATPLGFTAHLGPIFAGLIMPFWGVVGSFLGVICNTIANPILYKFGYLRLWHEGMDTIQTTLVNSIDFWLSFSIGISLAIAMIGVYQVVIGLRKRRRAMGIQRRSLSEVPEGRGDFPIWLALGLYFLATSSLVYVASFLLRDFSRFVWFFIFFGFIFTPIQSFVNARLRAMVGQTFSIPYVREATILLSGYRGIDIWFVPFPLANYGATAQKFREIELVGMKFTSMIKAEVVMVPIIFVMSLVYWSYIWKLAPIPSAAYPYAQKMWRLGAYNQCLWLTGTFKSEIKTSEDRVVWKPANLTDGWWYWRARVVNKETGEYGPWTRVRTFYVRLLEEEGEIPPPKAVPEDVLLQGEDATLQVSLIVVGPEDGAVVRTAIPELTVRPFRGAEMENLIYYFEVDNDPTFTGPWLQKSTDRPWLFKALKPKIIGSGLGIGLLAFVILSIFNLPTLLIYGYVRSLTTIPHYMIPEIIGALLARYYFWKKYGKKQWRLYAPVLAVGFSCGMALIAMAAIAIALIKKSVSVLIF